MHDPREGIDTGGNIRTGAHRSMVPPPYEPVLADLSSALSATSRPAPVLLYLYGSVATGTARPPASDVDTITVGLTASEAASLSEQLSQRFEDRCRAVDIGAAQPEHYTGDGDAAYGNRAFLRHYCVHLTGPDLTTGWPAFPADARAARGFNGDIAEHHRRWISDLAAIDGIDAGSAPTEVATQALARRVARKTLLAVAGLVSLLDWTWTTNRVGAAARYSRLCPSLAPGLEELVAWSGSAQAARRDELHRSLGLGGSVGQIVTAFSQEIGTWS